MKICERIADLFYRYVYIDREVLLAPNYLAPNFAGLEAFALEALLFIVDWQLESYGKNTTAQYPTELQCGSENLRYIYILARFVLTAPYFTDFLLCYIVTAFIELFTLYYQPFNAHSVIYPRCDTNKFTILLASEIWTHWIPSIAELLIIRNTMIKTFIPVILFDNDEWKLKLFREGKAILNAEQMACLIKNFITKIYGAENILLNPKKLKIYPFLMKGYYDYHFMKMYGENLDKYTRILSPSFSSLPSPSTSAENLVCEEKTLGILEDIIKSNPKIQKQVNITRWYHVKHFEPGQNLFSGISNFLGIIFWQNVFISFINIAGYYLRQHIYGSIPKDTRQFSFKKYSHLLGNLEKYEIVRFKRINIDFQIKKIFKVIDNSKVKRSATRLIKPTNKVNIEKWN